MNYKKRILTLRINKIWFDKIKSGEKNTEYREVKPYYKSRIEGKNLTHCRLIAGYSKDAPKMTLPIKSIEIKNSEKLGGMCYCINF
jgi:hypothetical protein